MRRSRAVAASVARLVIYIEILHATEAGVDLDTNRKTPLRLGIISKKVI